MHKRSVLVVVFLAAMTFGLYGLIWHVKTKEEMVAHGADIPTAWLLIVPIANLYWIWKWCGGIEYISRERMTAPVAFLLHMLIPLVGMAILQDTMNKAIDRGLPNALPEARVA
jgi:hypothetical protein